MRDASVAWCSCLVLFPHHYHTSYFPDRRLSRDSRAHTAGPESQPKPSLAYTLSCAGLANAQSAVPIEWFVAVSVEPWRACWMQQTGRDVTVVLRLLLTPKEWLRLFRAPQLDALDDDDGVCFVYLRPCLDSERKK